MSDVLRRKMFAVEMAPKDGAMNVGIMSGFAEPEEPEYEGPEMEEGESGEEGEDMYEDRRPDNLEIIANNLRGDYKSLDNRYAELAMKVGEEAAAQTPPEVIALMQPQMAQQMQGGIAGLPQGQQVMPGATGAPPMPAAMPPGPSPMAQGPMPQMANGGLIQKYALGALVAPAMTAGRFLLNAGRSGLGAISNYGVPFTMGATGLGLGATTVNALRAPTVSIPSNVPIYSEGQPTDPEAALVQGAQSDALRVPYGSPQAIEALTPQAPNIAQGLNAPGITPESNVPKLPMITDVIGAPAVDTSQPAAQVAPLIAPKEAPEEKGLKERTAERAAIYKDILGDDKEAMQSQALLAIADFGLRLAGAKGRSIAERISKAGEALPGQLAKVAEKATDTDKAIKMAALKAAEEDMALEKKLSSAQTIAAYKKAGDSTLQRIGAIAESLARNPALSGLDERFLINIARLYDNDKNVIKTDVATGEVTLSLPGFGPQVLSPATSASQTLSYVNPTDPMVQSKQRYTKVLDPDERKKITAKIGKNEVLLSQFNKIFQDFQKDAFGVVGGTKSVYNFVVPLIPFADGSAEQARAESAAANLQQQLKSFFSSDQGRQLKAEYKDVEKLADIEPGKFFNTYKSSMIVANEARRRLLENTSALRAQLTGGEGYTLKALPTGAGEDDPLTPAFASEMNTIASANPSMLVYFRPSPNAAAIQLPVSQALRIIETAKSKATENRAQGMRL